MLADTRARTWEQVPLSGSTGWALRLQKTPRSKVGQLPLERRLFPLHLFGQIVQAAKVAGFRGGGWFSPFVSASVRSSRFASLDTVSALLYLQLLDFMVCCRLCFWEPLFGALSCLPLHAIPRCV